MKDAQRMRLYAKAGHDVADTIMLAAAVTGAGDVPRVAAMTVLSVAIMDVIERNFSREDIPGIIDQMHKSLHGSLKLVENHSTQLPESVKH